MPPEPGLQTSVKPEIALGLGFSPSQPQSRASPAHPGIHPITRSTQGFIQLPGGNYLQTPGDRLLSEDPAAESEADPSPSTTILNKVLEAVPYHR